MSVLLTTSTNHLSVSTDSYDMSSSCEWLKPEIEEHTSGFAKRWDAVTDKLEESAVSFAALAELSTDANFIKSRWENLNSSTCSVLRDKTLFSKEVANRNWLQNRYTDSLPFDWSRVEFGNDKYFNGSTVTAGGRRYLMTQGPLPEGAKYQNGTVKDHWGAILESGASTIVSLAMCTESGLPKCAPFWEEDLLPEGVTKVSEEGAAASEEQAIVVRTFRFKKREIRQFHYLNWPDHGVADITLFRDLISRVNGIAHTGPMVVHCSAGIGRSGVFVAAHSLWDEEGDNVNIDQTILKLRLQRARSVQTLAQYAMLHSVLANR
jgi:protein tyrosine phosphatase